MKEKMKRFNDHEISDIFKYTRGKCRNRENLKTRSELLGRMDENVE